MRFAARIIVLLVHGAVHQSKAQDDNSNGGEHGLNNTATVSGTTGAIATDCPEEHEAGALKATSAILEPAIVVIPEGCFQMGSPENQSMRAADEGPVHEVCFAREFGLGSHEVTFADYDRYVAATDARKPKDFGWGRCNRPVVDVDWDEAVAYAAWLSQSTGKHYRLPTEAEWEYGARAGRHNVYWWGSSLESHRANCDGCGSEWDGKQIAPVGTFAANAFGLFDTAGNVEEWTCSEYAPEYGGQERRCSTSGQDGLRVVRGGSWFLNPRYVRPASRSWGAPDYRTNDRGFRLAEDL